MIRATFLVLVFHAACMPRSVAADDGAVQRVPWTTSRLIGSPDPPLPLRVERVFPRLRFSSPTMIVDLPGRARRMVLEQNGRLVTFEAIDDPTEIDVALDLQAGVADADGERVASARDLALDPDFERNGFVYMVWSIQPHEIDGGTRVTRFKLGGGDMPKIDPASRLDIIRYPSGDHVGASLTFGPDGLLWITTGDGSLPFPPDKFKTAQNLSDLRGKVLRIDVRGSERDKPYVVPPDNPFVADPNVRGEVFAFGLRNGFRSAIQPITNQLWVADVGWERCEMVHRIEKGGNHGWSLMEGPFPVDPNQLAGPSPIIPPAIVLQRSEAQSITGGVFISESAVIAQGEQDYVDNYVFGCYVNGGVWMADPRSGGSIGITKVAESGMRIIGFATTTLKSTAPGQHELLLVDHGGTIARLLPNRVADADESAINFPRRLSDTGLFEDVRKLRPSAGVAIFHPRATMYRDGAVGIRMIGVPGLDRIKPLWDNRQYVFPVGTVFANTLFRDVVADDGSVARRRIETQILAFDGLNWDPYSYRWNDEETDADLVSATGDRRSLVTVDPRLGTRTFEHAFASRNQCMTCHHSMNQGGLSFSSHNLSGPTRPQTRSWQQPWTEGCVGFENWSDLADSGYVVPAISDAAVADPTDESASLDARARSYLAINCSACHMPGGGATSGVNLLSSASSEDTGTVDAIAMQGDFGLDSAKVVVPGRPDRSVLMYRTATLGPGRMPKLGSYEPDLVGNQLIWDWIASLDPSDAKNMAAKNMTERTSDLAGDSATVSSALRLWHRQAVSDPVEAREQANGIVSKTKDPVVAGLFEPWIEVEKRQSRVGDSPDTEFLLAMSGDAIAGAKWFAESASSQCRNCHRVGGDEPLVGPSLRGIGSKRTRAELLDQLLQPSAIIEPAWQTHTVLTVDGEVIVGLRVSHSEDAWTIRGADGRDRTVPVDEIESASVNPQSLMPSGLCASMSPQDLANLLAFLHDLR